ncbi:MAG: hypothetical protein WAL98_22725, partial [Desulfatiglandaceae bacterium]
CLACFFQGFDTGRVWIKALLEDVTGEILFAVERAIERGSVIWPSIVIWVEVAALNSWSGKKRAVVLSRAGFFKMPHLPWLVRLENTLCVF